ncbi:MAG TPA: hypothetical protein VFW87_17285 [Pirellulales bacterium]|nr:hypothetical protein [Pirellulales bacterium]
MQFHCTLTRRNDGRWLIRHDGQVGVVEATAESREAALEKMRGELRYRLELCPCSGESYQHITIELDPSAR